MAYDSMNAFYLFIFESFVNKTLRRSIKADKNSLSSLASSDVMMEFVSSRDFFDGKSHCHTGKSLRSSRFLSFSKRSRTGGKLRKSGKIRSRGTPGVLLRSPAFRSLVRSPRRLKEERNWLLRRLHRKPINGLVLSTFCFLTNQRKVQILD